MKLLDRLMIYAYLKAYLICLVSLLSLYVVVDMFTNIEDFAHGHDGWISILKHIATYYGYKLAQIFDRLCEAIVLLAGMFTVAWMQRNNELLPLLSAGVSTRRAVRPVLIGACGLLCLAIANQEFVIPRISTFLNNPKDDPGGNREVEVQGFYEPNGIHIEGGQGWRKSKTIKPFYCTIPESIAEGLVHLEAQEARYLPPGNDPHSGGWLLINTKPLQLENWDNPRILEMIDPGKYFLHTKKATFEAVTRTNRNWFALLSTTQLRQELCDPNSPRLSSMAVLFHMRMTRPILGMLLVFLGLSVILRDQNRNIFISAALCLIMCAIFFGAIIISKQLGDNDYVGPALSAWLPVLCFGPIAFVLFDAIHT
jgi:lipopolysaccharide export system permease protein